MPSGSKRRKAKKKKQAGEAHAHYQQHGNKEDSGNEQELENEHELDHEQEQDHGHEEDPITPKTPVQSNEGEEKEKGKVEGGSSDTEEVGFLDGGFNQNQENHTETSFQLVESTDSNLLVPENGGGGSQNEVEVSSGGALEDNDGPTRNLGPLISTEEGHPKAAPARMTSSSSSSSSSSDHVKDDRDEIHDDEKESRTDVGVIALDLHDGDESEVSSSKLVGSEENETDQSLGPLTNVNETLPSSKDNDDTHVDMEDPSEELESSDGDESKLDVVSTMATLDANESIQSVGSVDSPRSVYSQQYMDQISNERAELASQDQDRGSEGFSETPFQELGSKVDFVNAESGDKDVYKVQIEATEIPQEEDHHGNSLTEESLKGLRNEENIQVPTEIVTDDYSVVMEELTQVVADLEKPQVTSSVSLAAAIEESEAIPKVDENDAKESVMPLSKPEESEAIPIVDGNDAKESVMRLSKSESVNSRHISAVSTSGEVGEKVFLTGEGIGDAISTTQQANQDLVSKESVMPLSKSESVNSRHISAVSTSGEAGEKVVSSGEGITQQANQDLVSAGEAGENGVGLIKVQGTSADPNEISAKEIESHPRNGTNGKKINLPQREPKTSWLNCCGIMDLFTAGRS